MNLLEHLSHALVHLLQADATRVVLGEDVCDGTMLGLTRAAADDPKLAARLLATPLCPTVLPAHAAGLAAEGFRPLVLVPDASALLDGAAALREAGALAARGVVTPVTFFALSGPGFGIGDRVGEGPESNLCRLRGVRVVVIARADEAAAMLAAAFDGWAGDAPTVLLLPRELAVAEVEPATDAPALSRPFARPRRVRDGQAATVFTWGACVSRVETATAQTGLDVRIVDVECLAPLDHDSLLAEAQATGKLVIAHAGPRAHGVGAELAARFADHAILSLDAPVTRVTGQDAPLQDEQHALPSVDALARAITHVARY